MSSEAIITALITAIGSCFSLLVYCVRYLALKLFDEEKGILTKVSNAHIEYLANTSKLMNDQAENLQSIDRRLDDKDRQHKITRKLLVQLAQIMLVLSENFKPEVVDKIKMNIHTIEKLIATEDGE